MSMHHVKKYDTRLTQAYHAFAASLGGVPYVYEGNPSAMPEPLGRCLP
jgi:hypothetical protein